MERVFFEANKRFLIGDYRNAAELYRRLLNEKNSVVALSIKGLVLMRLGEHEEGRTSLYQAIENDPDSELSWHNKCILHLEKGDFKGALECCEMAMKYRSVSASIAKRLKDLKTLSEGLKKIDIRDSAYIDMGTAFSINHPKLQSKYARNNISMNGISENDIVIVEYRCPVCGNVIAEDDIQCRLCGTIFIEGEEEIKEIVEITEIRQ
ncbi:MAG: hypothetical protein QXT63_06755 [Thermoplasmata archaeon]